MSGTTQPYKKDQWNAFMTKDAVFGNEDLPVCPCTASVVPKDLMSFDDARKHHNKMMKKGITDYHVRAFVHFYVDDAQFDGMYNSVWSRPNRALAILEHYDGVIVPDFSTYADFPKPIKLMNFYCMGAMGNWLASKGFSTIPNGRWGTEETWGYCYNILPMNSMIAIGSVASGIHLLDNRPLFEEGLRELVRRRHPHTLIFYGSVNNPVIDQLRHEGIEIIFFRSKTDLAFAGRNANHE